MVVNNQNRYATMMRLHFSNAKRDLQMFMLVIIVFQEGLTVLTSMK